MLEISLDEVSVKVRAAGPGEDPDDGENRAVWAGVVPLRTVAGLPEPSPLTDPGMPLPSSVRAIR